MATGLWAASEAYERYMGRWSRSLAPIAAAWFDLAAGSRCIEVGCGTGVLTRSVLDLCDPAEIVGIDSSAPFLETARAQIPDPRVSFQQSDALALPVQNGQFDAAISGLVLNFVPDQRAMIAEMRRVVRPGGTVGLYVWDYPGHMQIMRHFFDAAMALDPKAAEFDDGIKAPYCRPEPLRHLLEDANLTMVESRPIDIPAAFESFEDYWTPFLGGTGSAPRYCMSLSEEARETLREAVRARLPTGPDGEILLALRAWAVKGRV